MRFDRTGLFQFCHTAMKNSAERYARQKFIGSMDILLFELTDGKSVRSRSFSLSLSSLILCLVLVSSLFVASTPKPLTPLPSLSHPAPTNYYHPTTSFSSSFVVVVVVAVSSTSSTQYIVLIIILRMDC